MRRTEATTLWSGEALCDPTPGLGGTFPPMEPQVGVLEF